MVYLEAESFLFVPHAEFSTFSAFSRVRIIIFRRFRHPNPGVIFPFGDFLENIAEPSQILFFYICLLPFLCGLFFLDFVFFIWKFCDRFL